MRKSMTLALAMVAVLALCIAGCGGGSSASTPQNGNPPSGSPSGTIQGSAK